MKARFVAPSLSLVLLGACASATDGTDATSIASSDALSAQTTAASGGITETAISASSQIPSGAPAAGTYRLHMIDVGTGLSMLVQGADFTMLYDAGSNDDAKPLPANGTKAGNQNRLLAYLYAAVGPSGGPECVPQGDAWTYNPTQGTKAIDHLILSHAHEDHMSMMTAVMHCYDVKNVWDPGAIYTSAEYKTFTAAVRALPNVHYHTAAKPSSSTGITWTQFAENDVTALGEGALFKVLHADSTAYPSDINRNSTVLRLTLGTHAILFAGDAEAGSRAVPMSKAGDVEALLLANHASELAVDVLQVGHHGSETSSRSAFVDAVFPAGGSGSANATPTQRYALLSSGPRSYSGVVLPDKVIVSEYESLSSEAVTLLETNVHDAAGCPTKDRVSMDDSSPAGCDNYLLTLQ